MVFKITVRLSLTKEKSPSSSHAGPEDHTAVHRDSCASSEWPHSLKERSWTTQVSSQETDVNAHRANNRTPRGPENEQIRYRREI